MPVPPAPGYIPTVFADSLYLWIGTPAIGAAVAHSTTLSSVVFSQLPGQAAPVQFTPEDVGSIITISGGGPVNPLMPPPYFVQGSTFVTTIAAYVSPTEVTLAAAPDTTIHNTGFCTVVCYRRCLMASDVATGATAIEFDSSIAPGTADTLQFTALAKDNDYIDRFSTIAMGQPVFLQSVDPEVGEIFGGYIDTLTVANYPGAVGVYSWTAKCSSWKGIASRRVVGPAIATTYTGPGDQVFTQVVLDFLVDEGVGVIIHGAPQTITLPAPAGAFVAKLLDQLIQLITTPTQGWYWTTDAWRNYILAPYTESSAPWDVDGGSDLFCGDTPYQVSITQTHNQMANFVYALGQNVLLNALNCTFHGNGSQAAFNCPLPLGAAPGITLNNVAQTVGILGVDIGKQWYWGQGSTAITQDSSGTPIGTTDTLIVSYQTQTPGVAQFPVESSLVARNQIEGTAGEYDYSTAVTTPIEPADLLTIASAWGTAYGQPATTVTANTLRPGLKTGQLQNINFPNAGIDAQFLIATIKMTTFNNVIRWDYTAFGGANIGNAITGLVQFINRGQATLALTTPVPVIGSGYLNSRPITIDHTQVPSDQVRFPMVFTGVYPWLRDAANGGNVQSSNGYDIIFSQTPDGSNPIAFERVSYDGSTGTITCWVLIASLSSTVDTVLYICWNNPKIITDQQNPTGVWAPLGIAAAQPNENYHGVYHLEEASAPYADSSGYGNNSTGSLDSGYGVQAAGLIGNCQQFNGAEGIQIPGSVLNNGTANTTVTFEAWVKTTMVSDGAILESKGGAGNHGADIGVAGSSHSGEAFLGRDDGGAPSGVFSTAPVNDSAWHFVVGVIGGTVGPNDSRLYVDGVLQGIPGAGLTVGFITAQPAGIGQGTIPSVYPFGVNGLVDEARVLQWPLSADWIKAEYNNQKPASTFYSVGNQAGGSIIDVLANPTGTVTNSTGALTAGLPVFGEGGNDCAVGTKQGNTTKAQMATGAAGATGAPLVYDVSGNAAAGVVGQLVPAGGTTGEVLTKNSGTDYDVSWQSNDDDIQVNGATTLNIIQINASQIWVGQTEIQINGTFI